MKIPGFLLTKSPPLQQDSREARRRRWQDWQGTKAGWNTSHRERALRSRLFLAAPETRGLERDASQPQRGIVAFWDCGNKAPQTGLFKENYAVSGFWSQSQRSKCGQVGVGRVLWAKLTLPGDWDGMGPGSAFLVADSWPEISVVLWTKTPCLCIVPPPHFVASLFPHNQVYEHCQT